MNIAIVGSRSFNDKQLFTEIVEQVIAKYGKPECIISGGAKGADTLGEVYAKEHGIKCKLFIPDWKKFGKRAGFLRNEDIVKNCDICIAFWDGQSHGTKHDIELCKRFEKHLILVKYKIAEVADMNFKNLI